MLKKLIGIAAMLAIAPIAALRKPQWQACNIAAGTHDNGRITKLADAATTTRHLVYKIGSDVNHVALAGTADIALGISDDMAEAAEDPLAIQLFGAKPGTSLATASAAITLGDMVVTAASGKIRTLPVAAGTYYIIGRAAEAAAADGDVIAIIPCFPTQRVVA